MDTPDSKTDAPAGGGRTTATEWVVIAALILVVIIGGITLLGERVSGVKEPGTSPSLPTSE